MNQKMIQFIPAVLVGALLSAIVAPFLGNGYVLLSISIFSGWLFASHFCLKYSSIWHHKFSFKAFQCPEAFWIVGIIFVFACSYSAKRYLPPVFLGGGSSIHSDNGQLNSASNIKEKQWTGWKACYKNDWFVIALGMLLWCVHHFQAERDDSTQPAWGLLIIGGAIYIFVFAFIYHQLWGIVSDSPTANQIGTVASISSAIMIAPILAYQLIITHSQHASINASINKFALKQVELINVNNSHVEKFIGESVSELKVRHAVSHLYGFWIDPTTSTEASLESHILSLAGDVTEVSFLCPSPDLVEFLVSSRLLAFAVKIESDKEKRRRWIEFANQYIDTILQSVDIDEETKNQLFDCKNHHKLFFGHFEIVRNAILAKYCEQLITRLGLMLAVNIKIREDDSYDQLVKPVSFEKLSEGNWSLLLEECDVIDAQFFPQISFVLAASNKNSHGTNLDSLLFYFHEESDNFLSLNSGTIPFIGVRDNQFVLKANSMFDSAWKRAEDRSGTLVQSWATLKGKYDNQLHSAHESFKELVMEAKGE